MNVFIGCVKSKKIKPKNKRIANGRLFEVHNFREWCKYQKAMEE
jgi:hypothetical protein